MNKKTKQIPASRYLLNKPDPAAELWFYGTLGCGGTLLSSFQFSEVSARLSEGPSAGFQSGSGSGL